MQLKIVLKEETPWRTSDRQSPNFVQRYTCFSSFQWRIRGINWIHLGSKEAGPRVAAIIAIVETCRRLSLPIRDLVRCFRAGPIFRSIESPNSRPALGLHATNRRNPATPSTVQLVRRSQCNGANGENVVRNHENERRAVFYVS